MAEKDIFKSLVILSVIALKVRTVNERFRYDRNYPVLGICYFHRISTFLSPKELKKTRVEISSGMNKSGNAFTFPSNHNISCILRLILTKLLRNISLYGSIKKIEIKIYFVILEILNILKIVKFRFTEFLWVNPFMKSYESRSEVYTLNTVILRENPLRKILVCFL